MSEHTPRTAYQALESRFARIGHIAQVLEVLHWDQATMMPAGGAEDRSEQFATLEVLEHELLADPKVRGQIERLLQPRFGQSDKRR